MPHTSHHKKSLRQKRTHTVDQNGWTQVSSHQRAPTSHLGAEPSEAKLAKFHPVYHLPVAEDMTEERLVARYKVIEGKWRASEPYKHLYQALREALEANPSKVNTCVCFGTGSMSGVKDGWIQRHEVALYQIAAFKSAVDTIEEVQSHRPAVYAQEPAYNTLDMAFLSKLEITTANSPVGWDLIDSTSFTFCPGAEHDVSIRTIEKDPAFYMAGTLGWLRDRTAEYACDLPTDLADDYEPEEYEQPKRLEMIDKFVDDHNVYKLPDLDAADFPFHDEVLYWRKPH